MYYFFYLGLIGTFIFLSITSLLFSFQVDSIPIICIAASGIGLFLVPQKPLFLAYGNEVIYPLAEGSASGYLIAGIQFLGFASGLIFINLIDKTSTIPTYIIFCCFSIFMLIALFFVLTTKQDLKRSRH
jgi:hypothetical protein